MRIVIGGQMSLIGTLAGFIRRAHRSDGTDDVVPGLADEHLAVAALLVRVARIDGMIADRERQTLLGFLETSYGLDQAGAESLLARADRMDLEVDDVGSLVEMLGHEGHGPDGTRLLAMAYRIAAADGGLAEFEEDLIWRMGHLLRLDDAAISDIRARNVGAALLAADLRA